VLNPSRIKVKIWAFIFDTPHVNLSDFKPEGFDSFTYLKRPVLNSENNVSRHSFQNYDSKLHMLGTYETQVQTHV